MNLSSKEWSFHRSVIDGEELIISGLDIWKHEWNPTRRYIKVKDPLYGQNYNMAVYEITDGITTVTFAAGEFSNMVWGIYTPISEQFITNKKSS